MAIKFALVWMKDDQEYEIWHVGVCFGSIKSIFRACYNGDYRQIGDANYPVLAGTTTTTNAKITFERSEFIGIRLDLKNGGYFGNNTKDKRLFWDSIHDKLLSNLLDDNWIQKKYEDDQVSSIFYDKEIPTSILMSSVSMYRLWDNARNFINIWPSLDHLNLIPIVQYAACINILTHYDGFPDFTNKKPFDVFLTHMTTHLPWITSSTTTPIMANIHLTSLDSVKDWPTLEEQVKEFGYLCYSGREANWYPKNAKQKTNYIIKFLPKIKTKTTQDRYGYDYTETLPFKKEDYYEAIIKLNQEVKDVIDNRT